MACTDTGEVYTWGDNDEGQLGDASTNAVQRPRLVTALQVSFIHCQHFSRFRFVSRESLTIY